MSKLQLPSITPGIKHTQEPLFRHLPLPNPKKLPLDYKKRAKEIQDRRELKDFDDEETDKSINPHKSIKPDKSERFPSIGKNPSDDNANEEVLNIKDTLFPKIKSPSRPSASRPRTLRPRAERRSDSPPNASHHSALHHSASDSSASVSSASRPSYPTGSSKKRGGKRKTRKSKKGNKTRKLNIDRRRSCKK
jgi:hypothetical protein